jgi:hypothetical protein
VSVLNEPPEDRRQADRRPANGPITIWWTECKRLQIEGQLVDASATGFRVAHHFAGLDPGQQVQFRYAGGEGIARTVWTRIAADAVETGFHVLQASRYS